MEYGCSSIRNIVTLAGSHGGGICTACTCSGESPGLQGFHYFWVPAEVMLVRKQCAYNVHVHF